MTPLRAGDAASLSREIDIYKSMRGTHSVAAGALLTRQAAAQNGPAWDVLHARERTHLRFLERDLRHRAFLETWVSKEAGLKGAVIVNTCAVTQESVRQECIVIGEDLKLHQMSLSAARRSC